MLSRLRALPNTQRAMAAVFAGCLVVAAVSLYFALSPRSHAIRVSAGDARGRRAQVARALAEVARSHALEVTIVEEPGSSEALAAVQRDEIDVALVQGGLPPLPDVREVAPLVLEPMHLLARDAAIESIHDLRGKRVQLSPPGSGTRRIALELLSLAGMSARDFTESDHPYAELLRLPPDQLPDAIFHISSLPSPVASRLLRERGYRLVPLPYADALRLRDVAIQPGTIPFATYGASPPIPAQEVTTFATRMVMVANRRTRGDVVRRLIEVIESEDFARRAAVPRTPRGELVSEPEFPLHEGTIEWLHRNDPLLTSEDMQGIESVRSFLVSLIVAAVLAWRWYRSRRQHGLDAFIAEVSQIDRDALELERAARLDLGRLLELRSKLGEVKARALEAFTSGKVSSEDLLTSFLTHVTDVRSHLNAMILHERDRLQRKARAQGAEEDAALDALWEQAIAHDDRDDG